MRRLFALITFALATVASAATLTPVQLLNPVGSTAGQAIVSTGPSSAPGWGAVSPGSLAPIAANTVLGNFTASSAAPAAFAVPSCSTANSALKYTSGTGLSCGTTFALTTGNLSQFAATTSAQLLGVISDETGSGALVFGTSPTLGTPTINTATISGGTINNASVGATTPSTGAFTTLSATGAITPSQTAGIVGTTTNNNANAGSFGEYLTANTSGTNLPNATPVNATSVSLTAGDWDVECIAAFNAQPTTQLSFITASVSTTSATLGAFGSYQQIGHTAGAGVNSTIGSPSTRVSLASTTTTYCVASANVAVSTATVNGFIRARRVR